MLPATSKIFSLLRLTSVRAAFLLFSVLGANNLLWATPVNSQTTLAVSPSGVLATKTVVTLTATVVNAATSAHVTQGTVYFYDSLSTYAGPSGTGQPQPHLLGRAQVQSNGNAVFKTILPSATHTLTAVYMPTPQAYGSSSATATVTVTGGGNEIAHLAVTAGGVKNAYSVQSELRYQGVTAPTGTFTITDNTTSTTLATTTHIADQGATHAGYGYAQGPTLNASGLVSLVDMDGDGIPDLVAASGGTVSVLHGVGDGTYNGRVDYSIPSGGVSSIDTGDVNGDGHPDVVIADAGSNVVNVLLNDGSGGLTAGATYTVSSPTKVVLGDFGSGYLDIATLQLPATSSAPTGVNILTNSGTGTYGSATLLATTSATQGSSTIDFAVGDFDGDGHLDIITTENGSVVGAGVLFFSDRNGGFRASGTGNVSYASLVAGDLNDDGVLDFAGSRPGSQSINIFYSDNNGSFQNGNLPAPLSGSMLAADLNGDGRTDLVLPGSGSNFYVAYDNKANTPQPYIPDYLLVGPTSSPAVGTMTAASVLGDGLSDFFFAGGPPAEWLSYRKVTPVYPAASTSEQPLQLSSTTSLSPHSITVTYQPVSGGSYGAVTSNTIQFTPMGDVTPSLTVNPTTVNYNTSSLNTVLTATMATLSSTPPTGSITFYDGGIALGTATLSSGSASYTMIKPDGGTHSITAVYSGDGNYLSRTSAVATLTVIRETPTLTLTRSLSSQIVAGMVTLTGTISAVNTNVAGVMLQFDIAGQNGASCTITTSGASGSCSVQAAVPANGSLTAHVTNPLNATAMPNLASATATASITGTQTSANFGLQSSVNPSYNTQTVTFTATAPTVGGVSPNGTLSVYDGSTLIQTLSFASATSVSFTNSSFSTGTHTLTTHYNGDTVGRTLPNGNTSTVASFLAATSTQSVTQHVVTFTVGLPVTVSPQNTTQGTRQTISVFVNSGGVAITGVMVEFHDALSNPSLLGVEPVNSSGIATWTQLFAPGQHQFYVVATLSGAGQTTHTSSTVSSVVTPASGSHLPLSLNLGVTGTPGNYVSTITANYHSNYPLGPVSILNVNNGNSQLTTANFGPPVFTVPTSGTSLTAGIGAYFAAAGDVNGDGKKDLVVANYYDGTVSVYLGNGDGTFQSPNVITTSYSNPNSIILGDFDGDGNLDFLVICDWQQSGNLYYGDGAGNFTLGGYLNTPNATTDQIAIDLDKDGLLDTITVGFGIWKNIQNAGGQGAGFTDSYVALSGGGSPVWVAGGDFDNDGYNDIVSANIGGGTNTTNSIAILLNDGTGSLSGSNLDIPGTPGGITTGDFDEDGNLDIAVSLYDTQQIALFRGKGDGTFYPYTLISAGGTVGAGNIKLVDYDGDGSLDLLVTDTATTLVAYGGGNPSGANYNGNSTVTTSSGNVLYLRGDGAGNFDSAIPIPMGASTTPYSLVVADFDGDGLADLAVPQTTSFDNITNITAASTVGIFLGSNTATAVLANSTAVNTAGPVQIKAQHAHGSPDAYATTNSNTVQLQSLTTAAVTSSANPSPLGSSLTLTTTVSTVGGVVPTGTVQFFDGSTSLGTATISAGVANVTTTSLILGGHTITAFYNGDSHFQAVSATALAQTISPAATTVTLASSANPANYGASITLTATLGNNAATGTVLLMSGSTQIGSAQISSGHATFTTSSLPLGTSSLTAKYLGDSSYSGVTSAPLSQQVNQSAAATVTLSISPTSATYGSSVTMTATLATSAATGGVTFYNGSTALGTGAVQNGVATFTTTALPVGTTSVTASYSGDTLYSAHTSSAASVTITQATLTLNPPYATPASGVYGQSIVLTQVMPTGATGTVTFLNGGSSIGTGTIANGVATLTISSLPVATNTITASYGGNTNYASATTGSISVTIARATPTLTAPTASPTSASYGTSITLTQTVPAGVPGPISFYAGSTLLGTGSVVSGSATLTTTAIAVGTQSITAVSPSNGNFNSATSTPLSITITAPASATSLSASASSAVYGTAVTFTATATSNGNPVTSGTVDFQLGGVSQGTSAVNSSGVATLTLSGLNVGANAIIANFSAAGSYTASASSAVTVTITQATPSLAAPTLSPTSSTYGTAVTITLSVPSAATGTVAFYAGSTFLGTATISGGVSGSIATLTTSAISAGSNSITGVYSGNSNYASATSAAATLVVSQSTAATTTLATSLTPAMYRTSITFTATLGDPAATGTVQFQIGSFVLGTGTVTAGVATYSTNALTVGTKLITAVYSGDSNYATSTSSVLSQVITLSSAATTALTTSLTPAAYGAPVTFTATLGSSATTGTVQFKDGATVLGSGVINSGAATYTTSALTGGTHSITAVYSGDGNYATSTSSALSQVITTSSAATTAVTTSVTPAGYGTSVTFTATLGSSTATGTVQFKDGATVLGTGTVTSGVATYSTSSLTGGTHAITAVYSGDGNYAGTTSSALSQVITTSSAATTALTTSLTPAAYSVSVTFTATLGSSAATGTVQFKDGSTVLGTGTVSSGVATYSTGALSVGTHSITAVYFGDSNYAGSTSSALSQVITISSAATTTLTSSLNPSSPGVSVTFTATLGSSTATGTVRFKDGAGLLGTITVTAGVATYTTSSLSTATHSITAVYSGDSNYATTTSAALSQVVSVPVVVSLGTSTSLGNFGPSVSISYGQTAFFSASVYPYTIGTAQPSGAVVNFSTSGGTVIGNIVPVSGVATVGTSTLPIGTNLIVASYTDSLGQPAVSSTTVTVVVTQATPTLSAPTLSPTSASYGANVTISQAVPSGMTGSITFYSGSTVLGTGTIASGVATLTTNTLPVGTNAITTNFAGNANVAAATSAAASIVIAQGTASLGALTITPSSSVYGTSVTITQAVPTGVTGTMNFYNTPNQIGSATISGGVATLTTTTLPVGTDAIRTIYTGNANYASGSGGPVNAVITAATSSAVALSASTTSASYGTSVTLTSTVTVSGNPLTSGTVTFLSGGVSIGTATLNGSGVATLATTALPAGANVLTAGIATSSNYPAGTSTPVTVTIAQIAVTLPAPTISTPSPTYGTAVQLTQHVPAGVTGSISFYSGSTLLGTATISGSNAVLTTSTIPVGSISITGSFAGNTNYTAAVSSPLTLVVAQQTTLITPPTISPSSPVYGVPVTLTVNVSNGLTGTITFYSGSTAVGTATISVSGVATLTTSSLPSGPNTLTASFPGNTNYTSATSPATIIIVGAAPTATSLTTSSNSAAYGDPVVLTATVTSSGTPVTTGTVQFLRNGLLLGSGTVSASGVVTSTTTTLPLGASSVTASYVANTAFVASTSSAVNVTITQATPTLSPPVASPTSAVYGAPVTITQAVSTGVTGTITFYSGATLLGTSTINSGVATLTTSTIPAGSGVITGSYNGNTNYAAAFANGSTVTITPATPTLSPPSASPTTAALGTPVTLTQTVPAGVTGTITFYSGSTALGTATIAGGVATLTTSSLPAGSNSVTASFPGNANFASATSPANTVTIGAGATSTSLVATPNTAAYGSPVLLTATVTSAGAPVGSGTVQFTLGSVSLGSVTVSASGVATFTTSSTLPVGTQAFAATYAATSSYGASASTTTVTITQANPTLSAPSASPTSAPYGTAITLTQSVPPGVTGTITFYNGTTVLGTATISGGVATLTTSSLPGGTNSVTGSFGGNTNYAAAVSPPAAIAVSPATPTLAAPSASPTSAPYGTAVTLTQSVPAGATGTVTFSSNGVTLGTATISNGTATLTTSALPPGTNLISGSYSGNANYTAATSPAVSVTIAASSAGLAAPTVSPNSAPYGTSVTLTQTVPTGATGVITFTAGSTVLGTAPIVNGVATLTTTSLAGGNSSITGTYAGNSSVSGGTSAPATVTITPATLSLSPVTSSPAATTYNTPVTLTQLLPSGATGTVTFTSGSLTLGTAPILNGVATLPNISLPVGSNTVTASYAGNNNYTSATSTSSPIVVSPATATLAAPVPSPPNAVFGAPVTLTQAVPTGLTGTVTFSSNNVSLGTATIVNGVATLTTSALQGGTNFVIGAAYSGNNNYLPATSATTTIQIAAATPNLPGPVISPATASAGSPVTITQAVPAGATGTVTFTSGSTILGSAPIVNGVASLTTAALPVGANAVTGSYPGNNNYTAGTSPSASITITPASTTLPAPTASPTTSTFGASVTLTQTVPAGATGTITFASNGIALGTATIVNGAATLTTTALPGGANLLGTSYPGNGSFAAATSTAGFITVSPATLTLPAPSASATTAVPGTPINFTQSFPAGATGTATFSSGSTVLGMVPIVNGVATLTTATLPSGSNAIAVSYPGNNNYTAATSPAVTVAVGLATVSLSAPSASPTGASYGTAVTLSQPVPTGVSGTISFYNGSTLLGTATISNGVATLTTSTLPGGPNTITGSFGGNGSYAAAVSAPATITINPATPTLSAPSSSPSNAPYGTAVTLTQTVLAGATGTITFYNGTTTLGTATIANGVATLTTSTLPVGTNSITGSFGGNSNYTAATSAAATVTITPTAPPLAAPAFSPTGTTYGANVTLTQTVPAGVTGTITFYNGTTALGTATIVNGVATLTTTTLPAGSNSVTASYSGGGNYAPSTSAPALIAIAQSTPILVAPTASPTSATFGASVTLIQAVPAGVTGTITFYNGTTALGTATIANGVATLTTTTLPVGTNSVTGSFGGSGNYTVATSAPLTVTIAPVVTPGYTITANPPSLTIHAGSTGTSMLTFLPVGGYRGTFTLVCNNLPANASCQFMQNGTASSTILMSGNNQPVLVDLNVITSTMAHSATPGSVFGGQAPLLLNCGLFALIVLGRSRKSLRGAVTLCGSLLMGALLLGGLTGCAGGFGVATTPLGTSVATVTATASATSVGGGGSTATPTSLNLTITIIQ